mmetsp:Transcript_838/g.2602  ORF Transcript_838/g.2602 Transcript_838/m.2602 type:complete len:130 (-) Transcript_838:541-930(-)
MKLAEGKTTPVPCLIHARSVWRGKEVPGLSDVCYSIAHSPPSGRKFRSPATAEVDASGSRGGAADKLSSADAHDASAAHPSPKPDRPSEGRQACSESACELCTVLTGSGFLRHSQALLGPGEAQFLALP